MSKRSTKPLPAALKAQLDARDWSHRDFANALRADHNGWGSATSINFWLSGERKLSADRMERIARTLRIEPEYFAEYRLYKLRRQLTPEEVGLTKALKNLERIEQALANRE